MRLVAIALIVSGAALCQSLPQFPPIPDHLTWPPKNGAKGMSLLDAPKPLPVVAVVKSPACAIPLLNAAPAQAKTRFRMPVVTPPEHLDPKMAVAPIPVCK